MRIAVVTSFVRSDGFNGEDFAVRDQVDLLAQAGHDVHLVARSTDDRLQQRLYPLKAAVTVASGRGSSPLAEIERINPDVVHVHNTFPNLGRAWATHLHAPLVATLQSMRFTCANGSMARDGQSCDECLTAPLSSIRYGCYDGRLRSVPYAINTVRRSRDPLLRRADRIIVFNERSREVVVQLGYDPDRVVVSTNTAVVTTTEVVKPDDRQGWVLASRLTPEKGVVKLLERWPSEVPLDVFGDGPSRDEALRVAPRGVTFHGMVDRDQVAAAVARATGVVIPTIRLEGLPLVYAEALAAGCPVMAFAPNPFADVVAKDGTGVAVDWNEPLAPALTRAELAFPALRAHCQSVFATTYSPDALVASLEGIYRDAIATRASQR